MKLFVLLFFSLFSIIGFAVTDTATLVLSATVAEVVDITVTPEAVASALDLHTTQTDLKVAEVSESSNAVNGYEILARSTNAGEIVHAGGDSVAYSIKYDAAAYTLTAIDQQVKLQSTGGVYNGVVSDVLISYTGVAATALTSGAYSDTITFTIESL